jgi:hypothetical protein
MKEYVHYGCKKFDPSLFFAIRNRDFVKPFGGFWGSPIGAGYGWKEWNDESHFCSINEENSFRFTLSDGAKVLHIYSSDDLEPLPHLKGFPNTLFHFLDFEAIKKSGYDAIELHLSEERKPRSGLSKSLYYALYGWDCDSILVMDPDVVVQIN